MLLLVLFFITMKNKSKLFIIQLFLLITLFISCNTTKQNIYTMVQESGQLVFLRQVTLDSKDFPLRNTCFDVTVKIVDFELSDNNTVNYTLYFPKEYYSYEDKAELFFQTPSNPKITLNDCKVLYKDINKKKALEIRYTAKLSDQDLKAMLEYPEQTKPGITLADKTKIYSSADFSQKLFELGVLIK